MLAKLRPRLRRIKNAVGRRFRGTKSNQVIDTGLEDNLGGFDWTGLDAWVEALGRDAKAFQPLASAVDKLSAYIKRLEASVKQTHRQVPRGYSDIHTNMNDLLLKLFSLLNDSESRTLQQSRAANLVRSMESETEPLLQLGENWLDVDTSDVKRRANEVMRHFRRLQALMGHFIITETIKMVGEPAPDAVLARIRRSSTALNRLPDSNALPRTACAENTRVDVLHDIKGWIRHGNSQRVYWLSGMAGSGKTTIAYTLCDDLEKSGYPTASYFCTRRIPAYRKASLVLPEVSYQLSLLSHPFLCGLHDAMDQDAVVQDWPIYDQFERLIATPLRRAGHAFPAPPVVVIDALDECENRDEVNDMLRTLLAHATELSIKFVLTSRREVGTIDQAQSEKQEYVLSEQSLDKIFHLNIQEDIGTYLASELQALDMSSNELKSLTEQSWGLFRHAAWFVSYILSDGMSQPREQMLRLLDASSDRDDGRQRDATYEAILDAVLSKDFYEDEELADIKLVLHTVVYARVPFTVDFLRGVLGKLPDLRLAMPLESALQALHPVLLVSRTDGLLTPRYKSLQRYMVDQKRSGKHRCNADMDYITQVTLHCFSIIQTPYPPYNICNLPSSYLRDREVPRINEQIESAISNDLLDACRRWGVYLELSQPCEELVGALNEFLSSRLLLWMEVLNLKQRMRDGLEQLRKACTWLKGAKGSDGIQTLLEDAERFVGAFLLSPLSENTSHIYVSMLPLWPEDRPVSQYYMQQMLGSAKLRWTQRERKPQGAYWLGSAVGWMAYSPSGGYIAVGIGNMVQILDIWTQEFVGQAFRGHTDSVRSVAYSPDGAHVVSGSSDKTIRIWDAHTGQSIGQPLQGHTDSVNSVVYSPDGAHIVSGSDDNTVHIWDAHTGQSIGQPLQGHTRSVWSVAYSPNGAHVVSGSSDNIVRIWDAHTGQPIGQPLRGHTRSVRSVAYSPDGAHIVSGSDDNTIHIRDAHTGQSIGQPLRGHTHSVWSVAYSPNGAHFVSGSFDYTVRIWDAHTGQPIGQPLQDHTGSVRSVAYSPDGTHIVSGSYDNTIRIWDAHTGQPIGQPLCRGYTHSVHSVAYSPDGAHIVSGSDDNTVRIWDAHTRRPIGQPLRGHTGSVWSVAYSPNGAHIVSGSSDKTIRIWDAGANPPAGFRIHDPESLPSSIFSLQTPPTQVAVDSANPQGTILAKDWRLNEDGWVVDSNEHQLVWIPYGIRTQLACHPTQLIVSPNGPGANLDLSNARLGEDWVRCFDKIPDLESGISDANDG
ncbi:hypothetical protein FRC09_012289 [Ceratobasidium sp. 395]|nr:hypothetical protein FRC09_012289 [Ceratobasidium sp. 395]